MMGAEIVAWRSKAAPVWTMTSVVSVLGVILVLVVDRTSAFSIHQGATTLRIVQPITQTGSTRLASAIPQDHDGHRASSSPVGTIPSHDESSPSAVFGTPLNDETKTLNKKMVHAVKTMVFDVLFQGESIDRAYGRFYALETIARVPYFSYVSVLHLYETLGWWRRAKYIKLHFAESWNESHHLLLMESLGGNRRWIDRFVAEHAAFFYYWIVVMAYMMNPTFAYNLNEAIEQHAFTTYSTFVIQHKDWLETQPAPKFIQDYYRDGDLYMFDEMHMVPSTQVTRRPKCDTLYDAFCNVRDDEWEHVKTMEFLQQQQKSEE